MTTATEVRKLKQNDYRNEEPVIVPPADIYETKNEYVLKADLPGVRKENLEITLMNNELTIDGKIADEHRGAENPKYREYTLCNYHRVFRVDDAINTGAITASLENGILTLTLPKSEEAKPKKIAITVEH